jgi:mercuric ion transport protein
VSASRVSRVVFRWVAWLFLACVVVQFFLAGLAVFSDQNFSTHRDFGYTFGWLLVVLLVASLVGRMPRQAIGGALLLMVLFTLQSLFVALRTSLPAVAALHPLNGVAIFTLTLVLARAGAGWQQTATQGAATAGSDAASTEAAS